MKTKSKKIMGLLLALVMLIGCLPFNIIETYAAPGDVAIDATNFPDENFRDYVKKKFDKDNSGALSQDELDDVSSINIMEMNISSVKGIEYFSNLLSFEGYKNKLTELDISHNPALTYVGCGDNQLTALDISHNPALTHVGCRGNQLTALDLSHNPALTKVSCDYNQLTALDLSHNPALEYFTCDNNQLKELDISHNPALIEFFCNNNQLTALDISHNPTLTQVRCSDNQLTALDISHNPALTNVDCDNNQLTALDLSHNPALEYFYCGNNQLKELDLSHNPALTRVECGNNQLTSLDLSNNTALTSVVCDNNQLTTLDVSNNTALTSVVCDNNQLTTLDLSNNTALNGLACKNNKLTTLDVSNNTALSYLDCSENQLTTLKLPSSPIADKNINQKYIISVPKGTSIMNFPAEFDVNKIQGTVAGLNITSSGIEWDEQTGISFKYKLCDNPELFVDVSVETKTVPNPDLEEAKKLVEKAEADKTEDSYTKAKTAVDALVKGSGKTGLETQLKELRTSLDELKEAKEKAKDEIDKLPNLSDTEKDEYKGKVDNATDKSGVDQAVNDAKAKDTANKELKEAKEKAKDEIDKLPNLSDTEKDEYKGKVDNATDKSGVDQAVNDAKAKDTANKELKEAKEKAKDEIDKLPNLSDDEKDKYKKQVDDAQTKGDVEKAVEDAKAKDAENKNAADEKNKPATADDKNKAKDEIDKLPNLSDAEKDKYKGDVDNAGTKGEVEKAVEDAKAKDAENKNAADEKNKPATADDKNKAKDEIDKLPNLSDAEKDKYKGDVDNAGTKGDVAKIVEEAKEKSAGGQTPPTPTPTPTPNPSVDRDHDYWYRPYWTYSYGPSTTTKVTPAKSNLVKLEAKLVIGSKEMSKSVDGVEQKINMDIAPFIEGNRTMLPIRFVAEALGFNVQWDNDNRTVILIDKENVVKIPVDTNQIIVNGKVYESDVKPVIRNNRTMLPIANIARALGLKDGTDIIWNAATKEVKINREIEK